MTRKRRAATLSDGRRLVVSLHGESIQIELDGHLRLVVARSDAWVLAEALDAVASSG